MGILRSVSRTEPCPICGKPDYCFWKERKNSPGSFNLYCNRSWEAVGTVVAGLDGNNYISIYERQGGTIYESVEQREKRQVQRITGQAKEVTPVSRTVIGAVEPLPHEKLDAIYRTMMEAMPLIKYHATYMNHEGWSLELLKKHGICSFPPEYQNKLPYSLRTALSREQIAEYVMKKLNISSLRGTPGAYINKAGKWTFAGQSGILFPQYDSDGYIYRLRIRLDFLDLPVKLLEDDDGFYYMDFREKIRVSMSGPYKIVDGRKISIKFDTHSGKYRNFSSYKLDKNAYAVGFIENTYNGGCEAGNNLLFAMQPGDNYLCFWVIEGEKKALFCNAAIRQPFISLSGVNDINRLKLAVNGRTALDIMKQKGAKIAIVPFDADRTHNDMVMKCMMQLCKMLKDEGFDVFIPEWNEADGKGLDDLLASRHLPLFYEYNIK